MTDGITIRTARPEDAAALLEIYAPYVTDTAITFEYTVPSEAEFRGRIEKTLKRYPYIVAEKAGRMIGYAYAGAFHPRAAYDWACELSIYVATDARRCGLGSRLYERLEKVLGAQGLLNLNACIAVPLTDDDPYLTRASVAFHARRGYNTVGEFTKCGYKFNRWYNMVWMEKLIGEHLEVQPPVKPFDLVRAQFGL